MIPGGSNSERLTDVGTCTLTVTYAKYNYYLASCEALLGAFT